MPIRPGTELNENGKYIFPTGPEETELFSAGEDSVGLSPTPQCGGAVPEDMALSRTDQFGNPELPNPLQGLTTATTNASGVKYC
jgi:hypothetical protein